MSRLEAFMVALGMILLGMAAARADEPDKLPDIIRGIGPEVHQVQARPAPAKTRVQVAPCDDTQFIQAFSRHRPGLAAGIARPSRAVANVRVIDGRLPPSFGHSPVSTSGR